MMWELGGAEWGVVLGSNTACYQSYCNGELLLCVAITPGAYAAPSILGSALLDVIFITVMAPLWDLFSFHLIAAAMWQSETKMELFLVHGAPTNGGYSGSYLLVPYAQPPMPSATAPTSRTRVGWLASHCRGTGGAEK